MHLPAHSLFLIKTRLYFTDGLAERTKGKILVNLITLWRIFLLIYVYMNGVLALGSKV